MTQEPGNQAAPERGADSTPLQPWVKLWPKDWAADIRLHSVSMSAKGVFWSLYMLMHQGRGKLTVNGQPILEPQIASMVGCDVSELHRALEELTGIGLLSRATNGCLQSPELLSQMQLSETRARSAMLAQSTDNASLPSISKILLKQNREAKRGSGSGSGSSSDSESEGRCKRGPDSAQKQVIAHFSARYEETYHERFPVVWGRDGKAVKEMMGFAGGELAAVLRKIDLAFANDWQREHGVTLAKIRSSWASLHDPKTINGVRHHAAFDEALAWWRHAWRSTRGADPVVQPDDERALDAILERLGGFQPTKARIAHMLESEDETVRGWASLGFLAKHPDRFVQPDSARK